MAATKAKGVDYVTRLPAIIASLPSILAEWLQRQVSFMERLARQYAPIDTGTLVNSSKGWVERTTTGAQGTVSFNAAYAAYVNFGTGRAGEQSAVPERPSTVRYGARPGMRARPYLSLAAVQTGRQLQTAARELEDFLRAAH